jgi:4-hydroxybenzoate polyprenyltransferase
LRPLFSSSTHSFRYLSGIRFDEVLVLEGPPLLGAAFAIGRASVAKITGLAVFAAASCFLVAHIFALNDWSEMRAHRVDSKSLSRGDMSTLSICLLAVSLLLFSLFGPRTFAIASAIAVLSAFYSAPPCHAKGIPVLNSSIHFAGGMLHFLLGYSLFRAIDVRGVEIACFFALTFVAGHLTQEVQDRDEDLLNDIRTNAVVFGKTRTFAAALAIFTLADVLIIVLAARGLAPRPLMLMAGLYPLHLRWSLRALRMGLTSESTHLLRSRYRMLYAGVGVLTVVALMLWP